MLKEVALVKLPTVVFANIVLLFFAGCSTGDVVLKKPTPGYIQDVQPYVATVDWSNAEKIIVTLTNFSFTPEDLVLQGGKPYRLRLENKSADTRDFTSESFFKSVAVQQLSSPGREIASPYLKTVEVAPGKMRDLNFVAVKPGNFDLECSVGLHALFGMEGKIIIR